MFFQKLNKKGKKSKDFSMEGEMNAIVYDYLTAVSPKVAEKFKKDVKPKGIEVRLMQTTLFF